MFYIAYSGQSRVKPLTLEAVAHLLKMTLQCWIDDSKTTACEIQTWLDLVWNMLYKESPESLTLFEGIPLVLLSKGNTTQDRVIPLSKKSMVVQKQFRSHNLDKQQENIIIKITGMVSMCPSSATRHPALLQGRYIHEPVPNEIVKAMLKLDQNVLVQTIRTLPEKSRSVIKGWFAEAKLEKEGLKLLDRLPLFRPLVGPTNPSIKSVSAKESDGYIDLSEDNIPKPLKLSKLVIDGRGESKSLLLKIQTNKKSRGDIISTIIEEIKGGTTYTESEMQQVLHWLLKKWDEVKHECRALIPTISKMKFVVTNTGGLLSPIELLDPDDLILSKSFLSQGLFPATHLFTEETLSALRMLGMRKQCDVTPDEIMSCIDELTHNQNKDMALSLLQLLEQNTDFLGKLSSKEMTVAEYLKDQHCIPYEQHSPEYYPPDFHWYSDKGTPLSKPRDTLLQSKQDVFASGACVPFVKEQVFPKVFIYLGLHLHKPTLENVIKQFKECVAFAHNDSRQFMSEYIQMIKAIYSHIQEAWRREKDLVKEKVLTEIKLCVWNGSNFSEPNTMCTGELPLDLSPYMTCVPKELDCFKELFHSLGVKANAETNAGTLVSVLEDIKKCCHKRDRNARFKKKQRLLALRILHELHASGDMPESLYDCLLVPVRNDECRLVPVSGSAFIDMNWLKQELDTDNLDDEESFTLIHPEISMELAKFLRVPPVSRLLLDVVDLEGFTQVGQHEPLTVRLWNLLENSYEETDILKEIIQNAEDAGAKEVRFLIDMRQNNQAREKLFNPGMAACQGPAIWVYNDAVFTDDDFENILRLGGRTKERDPEKIGKFGTGFNSVYHITDVPCFVSKEYIQYFDPHQKYLGNILKDKSQPGVRVNLAKTRHIRRFPDQFMPFQEVFGFTLSDSFFYSGTLFRLPIRSKREAQKSEISKKSYNKRKITNLMFRMWNSSKNLLVFTKKIKHVSFFFLDENSLRASKALKLFSVVKESVKQRKVDKGVSLHTEVIKREMTNAGANFFSEKGLDQSSHTFTILKALCENSEKGESLAKSKEGIEHGLCAAGGIGLSLEPDLLRNEGEVYCHLPLSIMSTLPVHINGSFAVRDDRRSLYSPEPDANNISGEWNFIMLSDIICRSYIALLRDKDFMQSIKKSCEMQSMEELWPDIDEVSKNGNLAPLFDAFYNGIAQGTGQADKPAVFWQKDKAYHFDEIVFLSKEVQGSSVKAEVHSVLASRLVPEKVVIEISDKTRRAFQRVGLEKEVAIRTYDFDRFYDKIFFPTVSKIPATQRDTLVCFALKCRSEVIKKNLKDVPCVPVYGDMRLKKPSELVHPRGQAAHMFSKRDGVFPRGKQFESRISLDALVQVGMITDDICENAFVERCKSITLLHTRNREAAKQRCCEVLKYLSGIIDRQKWDNKTQLRDKIKSLHILPVVCDKTEQDECLPWKTLNSCDRYSSATKLYASSKKNLISSVSMILNENDEWQLSPNVHSFLGLDFKTPPLEEVLRHFEIFRNHCMSNLERIHHDQIELTCREIYSYCEETCEAFVPVSLADALEKDEFFFVDNKFVRASDIALDGNSISPYLYTVSSSSFLDKFPRLLESAKVKKSFEASDYHNILNKLYTSGNVLSGPMLDVAIRAAECLAKLDFDDETFLPDAQGCMRPVKELCYCDVEWIEGKFIKCHDRINYTVALKLNVKDVRQKMLAKYDMHFPGEEFGQSEKLETRIKGILESYPCDETILIELVQNADDAGATEIHFIVDTRTHNKDRLFGGNMGSLQGPSLCVFNNKSFSEIDIRGIQDLGEGSKSRSAAKTGRYGIGFNVVHHLTDCPSFITNGDKMCFFDPLLKYVPGATTASPGRLMRVDDAVRKTYPDVFPCYLEDILSDHKPRTNFTMFRFPLRKEASPLSNKIWEPPSMMQLLQKLEETAFESILFLQNITKLSISTVSSHGKIVPKFTVSMDLDDDQALEKAKFYRHVADFNNAVQHTLDPTKHCAIVTYKATLCSEARKEDWVVMQKVGYRDNTELWTSLMKGLDSIPVGGIAARLSGKKENVKGMCYCFLPLPIDTGIPVHVHGYFALEYESRRQLYGYQTGHQQTQWNCIILQRVIAPCYVNLLKWLRDHFTQVHEWSIPIKLENVKATKETLQMYHNFFPKSGTSKYWKFLINIVYETITSSSQTLFPVLVDNLPNGGVRLEWKTPVHPLDVSRCGYFNTLSNQKVGNKALPPQTAKCLENTLQRIRFPLLQTPLWIKKKMEKICKENSEKNSQILEVSSDSVTSFLQGKNSLTKMVPLHISKTNLQDMESLVSLIEYCRLNNSPDNLHGLPLLLTQDRKLRTFSKENKIFASRFCTLFNSCEEEFVHEQLICKLPQEMFLELTVSSVCNLLQKCASCLESQVCITNISSQSLEWFWRLWKLLVNLDGSQQKHEDDMRDYMGSWAILPIKPLSSQGTRGVSIFKDFELAPISLASAVIVQPFREDERRHWSIYSALEVLDVYKVCTDFIDTKSSVWQLILKFVTHKDNPQCALELLLHWIGIHAEKFEALEPQHREAILQYFSVFEDSMLHKLKRLPLFECIDGRFITIHGDKPVKVLSSRIPKREQATWMNAARVTFLQYKQSCKQVYGKLGLSDSSEIQVYAEHILPQFDNLTDESRIEHVQRIKQLSTKGDQEAIIEILGLQQLRFITDASGELKTASDFFDPRVKIFALMKSRDDFPPHHVRNIGLDFLREIGMQYIVTKELFLLFARQVETSFVDDSSGTEDTKNKSKILVAHLMKRHNFHRDTSFLKIISNISFLISDGMTEQLKSIHHPLVMRGENVKYSGAVAHRQNLLVWTSDNIVPAYAEITPSCGKPGCQNAMLQAMGVSPEPTLSRVIQHTQNVGKGIKHICDNRQKLTATSEVILVDVIKTILEFLVQQCLRGDQALRCEPADMCSNCEATKCGLSNVPIVFLALEDHHIILEAQQISHTVSNHFKPYLYQSPDMWGPYFWLFRIFGATNKPTISQYAFVLEKLAGIPQNLFKLNPNAKMLADEVSYCLFSELDRSVEETISERQISSKYLYLLGKDGSLKKSKELLYNDVDHYADRLQSCHLPMMKVSKVHETLMKRVIKKLPQEMQPKIVSQVVKEVLSSTEGSQRCELQTADECPGLVQLQNIVKSREFFISVLSIMEHNNCTGRKPSELFVRGQLQSLHITCMQQIKTVLKIHEKRMLNSEASVASFVTQDHSTELLVQHSSRKTKLVTLSDVAMKIDHILGYALQGKGLLVLTNLLMQKSSETLFDILADFKIKKFEFQADFSHSNMLLPQPGSAVPRELVQFIRQVDVCTSFQAREFVACLKKDKRYLYGRIIKYIKGTSSSAVYLVCIGSGEEKELSVKEFRKIVVPYTL